MEDHIRERVLKGANYMIENKCTMEDVAEELGISDTTVHVDLRRRLKEVNPGLKRITDRIIEGNIARGKVKGGLAMAKRRREEKREKQSKVESKNTSISTRCKDEAKRIITNMKLEDKMELVKLASEKGLKLEDEILPMLTDVVEMIDKSLFMENLRYMQELEGGVK